MQKKNTCFLNRIDVINEILELSANSEGEKIFYSDSFIRMVFEIDRDFGRLKITKDSFPQKVACLYYISFFTNIPQRIQFSLTADSIWRVENSGRTGIFIENQNQSFVIPNLPSIRNWNKRGNIGIERSDYITNYEHNNIIFEVDLLENESFEFIVLSIPDEDMLSFSHIYTNIKKEYTLTGPWVVVMPLLDCWRFMVNGKIYEYREGSSLEASARFRSQQAALFLYKLVSIEEDYAKDLVEIIKNEIAYSVMLDLEPDGRWVHGCWSDEMETHTRFQVDGIHLLIDHFEETKNLIFLEKALLAARYLLSLTDVLRDGAIWFLHDTLELDDQYNSHVLKSRAFQKSETNTLCINTHLSTLCAFIRLYSITKKEELKAVNERGINAAKMVLTAEPATNLYRLLYYFLDISFDRPYGGFKRVPNLKNALIIPLGFSISVFLPYVKKLFPRFVMPNGFTTRHLSVPHESYGYHIINLYDMLVLYQLLTLNGYEGHKWLWNKIDRAIKYSLEGHLMGFLIQNRNKFVPQFVEALIIYGAFNDKFDKKNIVDFVLTLKDNGYNFTSGCYGFDNLVTPEEYQVSEVSLETCSPHIESFNTSPRDKNFKELLVINTGSKNDKIDIILKSNSKRFEIILSNDTRIESPCILSSRDYLLIRLYDI